MRRALDGRLAPEPIGAARYRQSAHAIFGARAGRGKAHGSEAVSAVTRSRCAPDELLGMFTYVRAGSLREAQTCVQLPHNLQNAGSPWAVYGAIQQSIRTFMIRDPDPKPPLIAGT